MAPAVKKSRTSEQIFLFHGSDDFTIERNINAWQAAFEKKYSNSGIVRLWAGSSDFSAQLSASLASSGLFSQVRLVVIRSLFSEKAESAEPLLELLDRLPPDVFLMLWERKAAKKSLRLYKKIAELAKSGNARIYEFDVPAGADLSRFIASYAASRGATLSHDAIMLLSRKLGSELQERVKTSDGYASRQVYTLWEAASEVDKLAAYAKGETVTAADVERLVAGRLSDNVFALTEATAARNPVRIQIELDHIFASSQTDSDIKSKAAAIVGALAYQFRSLALLASVRAVGLRNPAGSLGWSPYRLQAAERLLSNFSESKLHTALQALLSLDSTLKSTSLPPKLLLERFLISL